MPSGRGEGRRRVFEAQEQRRKRFTYRGSLRGIVRAAAIAADHAESCPHLPFGRSPTRSGNGRTERGRASEVEPRQVELVAEGTTQPRAVFRETIRSVGSLGYAG